MDKVVLDYLTKKTPLSRETKRNSEKSGTCVLNGQKLKHKETVIISKNAGNGDEEQQKRKI